MDSSQIQLKDWIGRTETREDRITPFPMAALSATLDLPSDLPKDGAALPPHQLVRTTARGGTPGQAPAQERAQLPPIRMQPAERNRIAIEAGRISLPD